MTPHGQMARASESEADELLRRAAGLLVGRVAQLATEALEHLRDSVPYYGNEALAPTDLERSVHAGLEIAVNSFTDPEKFAGSGEFAWQVGSRRARQGVPLRALIQAQEIGATVLWAGMVERITEVLPDHSVRMALVSAHFWRRVSRDAVLLTEAHRRVCAASPGLKAQRTRQQLLKVLLHGRLDSVGASGLAVALDLPLEARYAVVVLTGPGASEFADADQSRTPQEETAVSLLWCPHRDGAAAVARLGVQDLAEMATGLRLGPEVRGGVSPVVHGLVELGRARDLAELALGTCTADNRLVLVSEHLSAALIVSRPDLAALIAGEVLGPVLQLDIQERALLMETLAAWLDHGGSASETAKHLYCHRNTVLNRLRRLERLTGRSLDRPRDVVDLALALDALRFGTA